MSFASLPPVSSLSRDRSRSRDRDTDTTQPPFRNADEERLWLRDNGHNTALQPHNSFHYRSTDNTLSSQHYLTNATTTETHSEQKTTEFYNYGDTSMTTRVMDEYQIDNVSGDNQISMSFSVSQQVSSGDTLLYSQFLPFGADVIDSNMNDFMANNGGTTVAQSEDSFFTNNATIHGSMLATSQSPIDMRRVSPSPISSVSVSQSQNSMDLDSSRSQSVISFNSDSDVSANLIAYVGVTEVIDDSRNHNTPKQPFTPPIIRSQDDDFKTIPEKTQLAMKDTNGKVWKLNQTFKQWKNDSRELKVNNPLSDTSQQSTDDISTEINSDLVDAVLRLKLFEERHHGTFQLIDTTKSNLSGSDMKPYCQNIIIYCYTVCMAIRDRFRWHWQQNKDKNEASPFGKAIGDLRTEIKDKFGFTFPKTLYRALKYRIGEQTIDAFKFAQCFDTKDESCDEFMKELPFISLTDDIDFIYRHCDSTKGGSVLILGRILENIVLGNLIIAPAFAIDGDMRRRSWICLYATMGVTKNVTELHREFGNVTVLQMDTTNARVMNHKPSEEATKSKWLPSLFIAERGYNYENNITVVLLLMSRLKESISTTDIDVNQIAYRWNQVTKKRDRECAKIRNQPSTTVQVQDDIDFA